MNFSSDLSNSPEYQSFRATVPLKKLAVDTDASKTWKLYDAGPRQVTSPLVCLAPVSGTADIFYKQMLYLTARGIRVLSVESPIYWSVSDWCEGFRRLLDHLDIERVHLFGASLGGFLAQKFAESTAQYSRVASIILSNAFLETSIFNFNDTATLFWILPGPVLKKLVMGNIKSESVTELRVAQSMEFIIERLDTLSQQELASRLTLNCVNCQVDPFKLKNMPMTIIDVFDESALSMQARASLRSHYGHAKLAHLKTGGNFPYLSRSDDVNMHLLVHLRQFSSNSRYSAQKPAEQESQNDQPESNAKNELAEEMGVGDSTSAAEVATEAS
ncbi:maspardin [Folsomia candida]|uniref:Maspardin n=1 Tax=Folsomia candida TaxID=158441 RepID=A0A226EVY6_FOLCA|nr:maspardin [Folsomia candida]XP_021960246.1 maspardin [Folsomia candida]XP_035702083.1 maspardin [Folsomia candida]OXA61773.1 Maspardin [Folsomia candida]